MSQTIARHPQTRQPLTQDSINVELTPEVEQPTINETVAEVEQPAPKTAEEHKETKPRGRRKKAS